MRAVTGILRRLREGSGNNFVTDGCLLLLSVCFDSLQRRPGMRSRKSLSVDRGTLDFDTTQGHDSTTLEVPDPPPVCALYT